MPKKTWHFQNVILPLKLLKLNIATCDPYAFYFHYYIQLKILIERIENVNFLLTKLV